MSRIPGLLFFAALASACAKPAEQDEGQNALVDFRALIASAKPGPGVKECNFKNVDVKKSDSVSSPYKGTVHGELSFVKDGEQRPLASFDLVFVREPNAGWKCSDVESKGHTWADDFGFDSPCNNIRRFCGVNWQ